MDKKPTEDVPQPNDEQQSNRLNKDEKFEALSVHSQGSNTQSTILLSRSESPKTFLAYPRTLRGTWRRDLRVGGELVSGAKLIFNQKGIILQGRRSNPFRTTIWMLFWISWWFGLFLIGIGVVATAIGVISRTGAFDIAFVGMVCSFPAVLISGIIIRVFLRWFVEPKVIWSVPWSNVTRLATDGHSIQIFFQIEGKSWHARILPSRWRRSRDVIDAIQNNLILGYNGNGHLIWMRPAWMDKIFLLFFLTILALGAQASQPYFQDFINGTPTSGPLAGIPVFIDPNTLINRSRVCANRPENQVRLINKKEGDSLVWNVTGNKRGWSALHLLWQAGTKRTKFLSASKVENSRQSGVFKSQDQIGLSMLIRDKELSAAERGLRLGTLDSLSAAWCSSQVRSIDITQYAESNHQFSVTRDNNDLIINLKGENLKDYLLLPVRAYSLDSGMFDTCAIPMEGGQVGLLKTKRKQRLIDFFDGENQSARVYLISKNRSGSLKQLIQGGVFQDCMVADSLRYSNIAVKLAKTPVQISRSRLRKRAEQFASSPPILSLSTNASVALKSVETRFVLLAQREHVQSLSAQKQQQVIMGFIDAIDWKLLFDSVSVGQSLPLLEELRQSMEHHVPGAGQLFLLSFAEVFIEQYPSTIDQFETREKIGERWLNIKVGSRWKGYQIQIPNSESAAVYNLIGRFILSDIARTLERVGDNGMGFLSLRWQPLAYRLKKHGIVVDIKSSGKVKATTHWLSGDFEYVGDRLIKKTLAAFSSQKENLIRASNAKYKLNTISSNRDLRYSDLYSDGSRIGWVGQFSGFHFSYYLANGKSITSSVVASGRKPVLMMAGSYVTRGGRTSGFAAQNGVIVNYLFNTMDGLVILHPESGMSLLDMEKGGVLPGTTDKIMPLRSLTDFHRLLTWIEQEGASAFQTHLLWHNGQPTIDELAASDTLRERRLLVQANYKGNPIVCVVDLAGHPPVSLFGGAVIAYHALSTSESQGGPGLNVDAIVNLDVGSFNILEVWDAQNKHHVLSPKKIGQAHNLVVITK